MVKMLGSYKSNLIEVLHFTVLEILRAIIWFAVFTLLFISLSCSKANAGEATVSWDANTENDLAGYKIYYGKTTGSPGLQTQENTFAVSKNGLAYFFSFTTARSVELT